MIKFKRGDVVIVDLGMVAKSRPGVVVSIARPDSQRNMSIIVPISTEIRNGETEIPLGKVPWLRQESVIQLLWIRGVDNAKIEHNITTLNPDIFRKVEDGLARILGL